MASKVLNDLRDDFDEPNEPWPIEPKDKDPRSEELRQVALLRDARMFCPGVTFTAIPNAGRRSQWEAQKRKREGMRKGALDLIATWEPHHRDDRGVAFIEMKDGKTMPDRDQRDVLNSLWRQGHKCGVFRSERSVLCWLRELGAPFVTESV